MIATYKESIPDFLTIQEILDNRLNDKIFLEESFQVGTLDESRWGYAEKARFFYSVMTGAAPSPIVWIDIQKCYDFWKEQGTDPESEEYYKKLLKAGYKYITVDGNNRTITLVDIAAGKIGLKPMHYNIPNYFNVPVKRGSNKFNKLIKPLTDFYLSRKIPVVTYTNLSIEEGGEIFRAINDGIKLNDHQKRQSRASKLADWVRETRKLFKTSLAKSFSKKVIIVLGADEFIAKCLSYTASKNFSKVALDTLYEHPGAVITKFLSKRDDWFQSTFKSFIKGMGKYKWTSKNSLMDLWVIISDYKTERNTKIKDMNKLITIYYDQLITLQASEETYPSPSIKVKEKVLDYTGLLSKSFSPELNEFRRSVILNLIEKQLVAEGVIVQQEDPSNRFFTVKQKIQLWKNQDGICPVTEKEIPLEEIFDHTKWQADHKDPFDNGGRTTKENGQLICAIANNEKSNKII